jgi:hypothetical protein
MAGSLAATALDCGRERRPAPDRGGVAACAPEQRLSLAYMVCSRERREMSGVAQKDEVRQ